MADTSVEGKTSASASPIPTMPLAVQTNAAEVVTLSGSVVTLTAPTPTASAMTITSTASQPTIIQVVTVINGLTTTIEQTVAGQVLSLQSSSAPHASLTILAPILMLLTMFMI